MRILGYNLDSEYLLKSKVSKDSQKLIHIDLESDKGDIEYFLIIRRYDMIVLNLDNKNYKRYLNLLKIINREYKLSEFRYELIISHEESIDITYLQNDINQNYKNIKPKYIKYNKNNPISPIIQNNIFNYFYKTPDIIQSISMDVSKQLITLEVNDNTYDIFVKSKKDIQVLLHFIRHYGEVINMEMILSGISKEPELSNSSPVESAISSLRKVFSFLNVNNPIIALKRVGYRFEI